MDFINKRIRRDINVLEKDNKVIVIDKNTIYCFINGPNDTQYVGGVWKIIISFPKEYPFKSPSIGFVD